MLKITVGKLTFVLINIYVPSNKAEHALFVQEVNDGLIILKLNQMIVQ